MRRRELRRLGVHAGEAQQGECLELPNLDVGMHCSRLGLLEVDHNQWPGPLLPLERNPAEPFFVEEFLGFPGLSSEHEVERSH